jgi:hypothetical protein
MPWILRWLVSSLKRSSPGWGAGLPIRNLTFQFWTERHMRLLSRLSATVLLPLPVSKLSQQVFSRLISVAVHSEACTIASQCLISFLGLYIFLEHIR